MGNKGISRRNFLTGSAAVGALAAFGMAGCGPAKSSGKSSSATEAAEGWAQGLNVDIASTLPDHDKREGLFRAMLVDSVEKNGEGLEMAWKAGAQKPQNFGGQMLHQTLARVASASTTRRWCSTPCRPPIRAPIRAASIT